jgi:hypothetical protein
VKLLLEYDDNPGAGYVKGVEGRRAYAGAGVERGDVRGYGYEWLGRASGALLAFGGDGVAYVVHDGDAMVFGESLSGVDGPA